MADLAGVAEQSVLKKNHQDRNRSQSVKAGNPFVHGVVFQGGRGAWPQAAEIASRRRSACKATRNEAMRQTYVSSCYGEKKRKKSHRRSIDFFSTYSPKHTDWVARKPQNFPATSTFSPLYYRVPTNGFQVATFEGGAKGVRQRVRARRTASLGTFYRRMAPNRKTHAYAARPVRAAPART
jgi:hypothetical protein